MTFYVFKFGISFNGHFYPRGSECPKELAEHFIYCGLDYVQIVQTEDDQGY